MTFKMAENNQDENMPQENSEKTDVPAPNQHQIINQLCCDYSNYMKLDIPKEVNSSPARKRATK